MWGGGIPTSCDLLCFFVWPCLLNMEGGGLWDQDDMPEMGEGEQLFLSQTPSPALSWANPMSDRGEGASAPPVLSQSRLVVDIPDV